MRSDTHRKVGFKARNNRHASNPVPHKGHRKATAYSRTSRIRKRLLALRFAPTVEDFDLDRDRLGELRPVASGVHVNRASAAQTASPTTHGG